MYQYLVFFDDDDSPEDNWFRLDNPDEKWRFNLTQPKECPPLTTWQRLPTAAAAAAAAAAAVAAAGGGGGAVCVLQEGCVKACRNPRWGS